MRKILTLALLATMATPLALPAMASAQSRTDMREDRRDLHREQRDLRDAYRHGDARDIRAARRDVAENRRDWRDDRRDRRTDRRESWRDYRSAHRDRFEARHWTAPFRYQHFDVGARVRPGYYAPHYVIRDYGHYGLRRPAYGLRWVRHYDDVLLINLRTGRVVTVYHNFFW